MIGNSYDSSSSFLNSNSLFNRAKSSTKSSDVEDTTADLTTTTEDSEDTEEATSTAVTTTDEDNSTETTAKSLLEDFNNQLKSFLMDSIGLDVDADGNVSLPGGTSFSAYSISVSFELTYSTTTAIAGATGSSISSTSLSLSASFEMIGVTSGSGSSFNPFATSSTDSSDSLSDLQELFSPENTAERILNFALSFFAQSDQFEEYGDTEEGRAAYAEYIGAAVQKGFDEAMGILGDVDSTTQSIIDETHKLVFEGFEEFVNGGTDSEKSDLYSSILSYSSSFSLSYSSTTTSISSSSSSQESNLVDNNRGMGAYRAQMNHYHQQSEELEAAEESDAEDPSALDTEA